MERVETVYCSQCKKAVHYHYDPVNHWKQLLLTILTLSLWLPIWLCLTLGPTKLCNECGGPLWGADTQATGALRRSGSHQH